MQLISVIRRILFLSPSWTRQCPSHRGRLKPSPVQKTFKKKEIADKGFTLIEIVMTMVILSIAVVGILQVFFSGLAPKNAPLSIEITTGAQLVQEGLERIKADLKNTACLNPPCGFGHIISSNYPADTITFNYPGHTDIYTRTTTISPSWGGNSNYTQVTVAVTHSSRTVARATTLVANY